jgi:hypothetical protein
MLRLNRKSTQAVLLGLMLIVGSVQADVSYFCGVMNSGMEMADAVMDDACCCTDFDDQQIMADESDPCCDVSVNLLVEAEANAAQVTPKPIKLESDVDPPDVFAPTFEPLSLSTDTSVVSVCLVAASFSSNGSAIYLTTQRLRI